MSDAVDAHPEAGNIQGGEAASDASGMSVEDAATSAFDDWDRGQNGIAEGERENVGQYLKYHADSAGTTVIGGLNAIIEPAVALRHGDLTTKREVIGSLIDEYNVHPVPEAEAAPAPVEYGQPALDAEGQPVATGEQAVEAIEQFAQANPIMRDERIQDHMAFIANDMRRQGFQPTLEAVYSHAVNSDPRYSPQARQAQEAQEVAQAKAASVQVSGGGRSAPSSSNVSDDLDDIIREQF